MSHPSDFKVSFASFDVLRQGNVLEQNHFAMSFGPFQLLFDQCMIQIDNFLMIALCVNGFAGFLELIIKNTALVPPDTKHDFSAEAIWSSC